MFSLDSQRRLVTNLGYPVMGTKGEIKIPPGTVQVNAQGGIDVDGRPVATLKVMDFPVGSHAAEAFRRTVRIGLRQTGKEPASPGGAYRRVEREFNR